MLDVVTYDTKNVMGTLFLSFDKKKMHGEISFFHFRRNSLRRSRVSIRAQEKMNTIFFTKNTGHANSRPFIANHAHKMSGKTSLGKINRKKLPYGNETGKKNFPRKVKSISVFGFTNFGSFFLLRQK